VRTNFGLGVVERSTESLDSALIEGMILATGLKPIPKEYVQGMTVPFQLTVCDQFGNEISLESKLSVDRSTTPRPKLVRSQSTLRESDKIPETREPLGREDPVVRAACAPRDSEIGGQEGD